MSIFRSFLKKRVEKLIYKLPRVDLTDLSSTGYSISEISKGNIDGLIIENVLCYDQIKLLIDGLNNLAADQRKHISDKIFTYPESIFELHHTLDGMDQYGDYFRTREEFWNTFIVDFEIDLIKIVTSVLTSLGGGGLVRPTPGIEDDGFCNPLTLRVYPPKSGHVETHCDTSFHGKYKTFFQYLGQVSYLANQLSYFMVLQSPDQGGDLVLYDMEWEQAKIKQNEKSIIDENGKVWDLADSRRLARQSIKLVPGEMIIFRAGEIWHGVNHVAGEKSRITAGGFITKAKENQGYYIWS